MEEFSDSSFIQQKVGLSNLIKNQSHIKINQLSIYRRIL